jgi:cell wall-associated NlpC family hydrolase
LTGIDYYGGLTPEDLRKIISNLTAGTKGTAIVEAALTRLGGPYSMAKRGSGHYVDCSYLAYWAYKQAGVSIPSTSVMQAKYCYDNGYVVGAI